MSLEFQSSGELTQLLCQRLRKDRLTQQMTQAEVAGRAGIGVITLSNLEASRQNE